MATGYKRDNRGRFAGGHGAGALGGKGAYSGRVSRGGGAGGGTAKIGQPKPVRSKPSKASRQKLRRARIKHVVSGTVTSGLVGTALGGVAGGKAGLVFGVGASVGSASALKVNSKGGISMGANGNRRAKIGAATTSFGAVAAIAGAPAAKQYIGTKAGDNRAMRAKASQNASSRGLGSAPRRVKKRRGAFNISSI